MKIKIALAIAALLSIAGAVFAQFPGAVTYDVETTKYIPQDLQLRRGETKLIRWRFLENGTAISIPLAATVLMNYKAPGATGGYNVATGTIYNATGGTVQIYWTSAMNPTNRVSDYDVTVADTTATLCRAFGRLNLDSQVAVGVATSAPGVVTLIDWATVVNNNVGSAPFATSEATGTVTKIIAGTGATVSPTSGVGDVTVNVTTGLFATAAQGANADTAHGWGNHATNGYLTASATSQLVTASITNGLASVAYVDAATGAVVVTETDPVYTTALNTTNILAYRSSAGAWLFQDFEGTDGIVYVGGVGFLMAQKDVAATSNHFINLKGTVTGYPELRGRGPSLENIPWMMNGGFIATNAGAAGGGYYAMSNGAWTVFTPGSGTGGGGAAQSPWTNNVDAAGYSLTGANNVTATNRVTANNGALTGNGGGWLFTNAASARVLYWDGTNFASRAP